MAQISKGTRLLWGVVGETGRATSRLMIPSIKSIPALGATPNTIQVTDLEDEKHTYIKGLQDIGGALEFTCNYTPEVLDAIDKAVVAQNEGVVEWCVEFPAPLNKRIYWQGEVEPVFNTEVAVDAVVEGTVAIVPNTVLQIEDIAEGEYISTESDLRSAITAGRSVTIDGEVTLTSPLELTKAGQTISGIGSESVLKLVLTDKTEMTHAIDVKNSVTFENLRFEALDTAGKPAIIFNDATNSGILTIRNCTFVGMLNKLGDSYEYTMSMAVWTATPTVIEDCTFTDCYTPIYIEGNTGVTVQNCYWNSGVELGYPSQDIVFKGNVGFQDADFPAKVNLKTTYVEEATCQEIATTWKAQNENIGYYIDGVLYE